MCVQCRPYSDIASSLPIILNKEGQRGVPIHLFADESKVDAQVMKQLHRISESGIAEHFVAVMPGKLPGIPFAYGVD